MYRLLYYTIIQLPESKELMQMPECIMVCVKCIINLCLLQAAIAHRIYTEKQNSKILCNS